MRPKISLLEKSMGLFATVPTDKCLICGDCSKELTKGILICEDCLPERDEMYVICVNPKHKNGFLIHRHKGSILEIHPAIKNIPLANKETGTITFVSHCRECDPNFEEKEITEHHRTCSFRK